MRYLLGVAVVVVGISVNGVAQQNGTGKVTPAAHVKTQKSGPMPMGKGETSSAANAKELKSIENQTAKTPGTAQSAGKKTTKAPPLKPIKDKPNPPINFGGTSASKTPGTNHQTSSSIKGRLKQKGTGHQ
jgi:hypothetical protein